MMSSTDEATQYIDSSLQLVISTPMVNSSGWATEDTFQQPTRHAEDVKILTKDLQEPIEWKEGEASK